MQIASKLWGFVSAWSSSYLVTYPHQNTNISCCSLFCQALWRTDRLAVDVLDTYATLRRFTSRHTSHRFMFLHVGLCVVD